MAVLTLLLEEQKDADSIGGSARDSIAFPPCFGDFL